MRIIKCAVLMTLISLCAGCAAPPTSNAFIRSSSDPDKRVQAVERKIGYLQSKLGVQSYNFHFATPPDKRLVATFIAEMNGEMLPDLSGEFHIPPTDSAGGNPGQIWVHFFEPKYQTGTPQGPMLELEFQTAGGGHSFSMPFVTFPAASSFSTGNSESDHLSLEEGRDYEVWVYDRSSSTAAQRGDMFKYTLKVRLQPAAGLQQIKREPIPSVF